MKKHLTMYRASVPVTPQLYHTGTLPLREGGN